MNNSILIIDDDVQLATVLKRALERRGWDVWMAHNAEDALQQATEQEPEHILLDQKLGEDSGIILLRALRDKLPYSRIVMLTGFASITMAVEAIKLGAFHYLTKPASVEEIIAAFAKEEGDPNAGPIDSPLTLDQVEWEHIQKVLAEFDGNVSAAARALNMHRRSLQRKLEKRPSPNRDIDI